MKKTWFLKVRFIFFYLLPGSCQICTFLMTHAIHFRILNTFIYLFKYRIQTIDYLMACDRQINLPNLHSRAPEHITLKKTKKKKITFFYVGEVGFITISYNFPPYLLLLKQIVLRAQRVYIKGERGGIYWFVKCLSLFFLMCSCMHLFVLLDCMYSVNLDLIRCTYF